ncbi:MAG: hypothetical protein KF708_14315 [Pirellulales bacterium]|nr:hypothetical protein [Pirellulales bacterium]
MPALCRLCLLPLLLLAMADAARAVDYKVASLDEPAPEEFSAAIRDGLNPAGLRVSRGSNKFCDIWLAKEWNAKADFTPSLSMLYPFSVGEFIGVIRYHKKGGDFRDQEVPAGLYTLRFALQPEDGNHVGTSETRDFMLLLPVADDTDPATMAEDVLWTTSAASVGTSHPAMLSLINAGNVEGELPGLHHNEEADRWSLRFAGQAKRGDAVEPLVVQMIVVGHASE